MAKRALWIVPMVATIAIVATGLAALPYGDGSRTCTSGSWEVKPTLYAHMRVVHDFVPYYSVRCESGWFTLHEGTLSAAVFWLFAAAAAIGIAFGLRRFATARAAGAAVLVLGVFGLASTALDHPIGAFVAVLAMPIPVGAFEWFSGADRTRAILTALVLPSR